MRRSSNGFTIVELLVIIVIIVILALISTVAYSGIQNRARASSISSELKATEKAFHSFKTTIGASSWWLDNDAFLTGSTSGNPSITAIRSAQPELQNFLTGAPSGAGLGSSSVWYYDNDGDTYNGCAANTAGVNFYLNSVQNTNLAQEIDTAIDDGNLACGKVRMSGSTLVYGIQ